MFERTDRICSKLKLLNNKCKHQVVNQLVLARRGCFPKVSMLLRQYCSQITAEQLLWEVRYSTVYFFFSLFIYCGHIINRLKNAKRPHFGHQNRESKTLRNFTNTEVEKERSLRSASGEQGEACEHSFIDVGNHSYHRTSQECLQYANWEVCFRLDHGTMHIDNYLTPSILRQVKMNLQDHGQSSSVHLMSIHEVSNYG